MNILHYQILVASKAVRAVLAAPGKLLVDFGLRRAHGAEAGLMAARASYLAGFAGTATVLADELFGIPSFGTMAHSFIEAHDDEATAFEHFATSRPNNLTFLIDTYDTLAAAQMEENAHLAKLVTQKGLAMSLDPTPAEKKVAEEINKLSGSNFDKAAMDKVVAASNQALAAYEDAAQSADPQIKSFAARMLPFAEEKRHIVEKMTGAGGKAASQPSRHGGASEGAPAATPAGKGTPALPVRATPSQPMNVPKKGNSQPVRVKAKPKTASIPE